MLLDIIRFNLQAPNLLVSEEESETSPTERRSPAKTPKQDHETIGEYLQRGGYSDEFRDNYLIPMTAAVWSTEPNKAALAFPAVTLVRFMWNHHLLSTVATRPPWMTIKEGSKLYIDAVLKSHPEANIHMSSPVETLAVKPDGKILLQFKMDSQEQVQEFDHVILASHGDQAMKIMDLSATNEERSILSAFETTKNTAILHSDISVSPQPSPTHMACLTPHPVHAQTPHRLVCLEYPRYLRQDRLRRLPNLLDEHPPAHPHGRLRPRPCHPEPPVPARSETGPGHLDLRAPAVQLGRHPRTVAFASHTEHAGHQLRRCVDEVRLPRGRVLERDQGGDGSSGGEAALRLCGQHLFEGEEADSGVAAPAGFGGGVAARAGGCVGDVSHQVCAAVSGSEEAKGESAITLMRERLYDMEERTGTGALDCTATFSLQSPAMPPFLDITIVMYFSCAEDASCLPLAARRLARPSRSANRARLYLHSAHIDLCKYSFIYSFDNGASLPLAILIEKHLLRIKGDQLLSYQMPSNSTTAACPPIEGNQESYKST